MRLPPVLRQSAGAGSGENGLAKALDELDVYYLEEPFPRRDAPCPQVVGVLIQHQMLKERVVMYLAEILDPEYERQQ